MSPPARGRPVGRLAPTPTGELHLGHGRTFWAAWKRVRRAGGTLIFRVEDLDAARCRPEFVQGMAEDLRWLGLDWDEGPDEGGPHAPYVQSLRLEWFRDVWLRLQRTGLIYPSPHSRKDVERALGAPHEGEEEAVFPAALRPAAGTWGNAAEPGAVNWRFRVPEGELIAFSDAFAGPQEFEGGTDFGDFLVWRKDGFPSYELAVVADDHAMGVTEVTRGADLLVSTARQLLLYRALGWEPPSHAHAPLMRDEKGRRLAKRDGARSLRQLRESGVRPSDLTARWEQEMAGWEGRCAPIKN